LWRGTPAERGILVVCRHICHVYLAASSKTRSRDQSRLQSRSRYRRIQIRGWPCAWWAGRLTLKDFPNLKKFPVNFKDFLQRKCVCGMCLGCCPLDPRLLSQACSTAAAGPVPLADSRGVFSKTILGTPSKWGQMWWHPWLLKGSLRTMASHH
jgi:hypothetical protein